MVNLYIITTMTTTSTIFVKHLKPSNYDTHLFAVLHNDETMDKFVKVYNDNKYLYIKNKHLKFLDDTDETNFVLKMTIDNFTNNEGNLITYIKKVKPKTNKKVDKLLEKYVLTNKIEYENKMKLMDIDEDTENEDSD